MVERSSKLSWTCHAFPPPLISGPLHTLFMSPGTLKCTIQILAWKPTFMRGAASDPTVWIHSWGAFSLTPRHGCPGCHLWTQAHIPSPSQHPLHLMVWKAKFLISQIPLWLRFGITSEVPASNVCLRDIWKMNMRCMASVCGFWPSLLVRRAVTFLRQVPRLICQPPGGHARVADVPAS